MPGLDGTGLLFGPLLRALGTEFPTTVVRYPDDQEQDLSALSALVARQLPDNPILVAESFSGLVALTLLANRSTRVRGVVFVGGFAEPPRPFLLRLAPLVSRSAALMHSTPSFLLRQYCLGNTASAGDLKLLRSAVAAVSPSVLAQRLRLVGTRHAFGKGKFDVPCHYLRATEDRLVPATCVDWFRQHFIRCDVTEIDGPHFLLQAAPANCAQAINRAAKLILSAR
jgi:pimeloyl-[acyl-carrier protein] methyl ester esterase